MSTPIIEETLHTDENAQKANENNILVDAPKQEPTPVKVKSSIHRKRSRYTIHNRASLLPLTNVRIFEPTYQLESKNPFNIEHVKFLLERCTKENVDEYMPVYKGDVVSKFCKELSQEIRFRIKLQHFDRYRLVVCVNVVEKLYQSMCMQIGFLWDHERDHWTHFRHETKTFIVTIGVFGVYWD